MNQFLTLYFFESIRTFYAWAFPLNVMVSVSILLGLAVGVFSRRKSWLWRIFAAVCLMMLAAAELIGQFFPSEDMIFFYVCGWYGEAALLCCCLGMAVRFLWTKVRGR